MSEPKVWRVTLGEDPETKEIILPFPEDLIEQMQWKDGDTLLWDVKDNGSIVISKQ